MKLDHLSPKNASLTVGEHRLLTAVWKLHLLERHGFDRLGQEWARWQRVSSHYLAVEFVIILVTLTEVTGNTSDKRQIDNDAIDDVGWLGIGNVQMRSNFVAMRHEVISGQSSDGF